MKKKKTSFSLPRNDVFASGRAHPGMGVGCEKDKRCNLRKVSVEIHHFLFCKID